VLPLEFTFFEAVVDLVLELLIHEGGGAHSARILLLLLLRLEADGNFWRCDWNGDAFLLTAFVRLWLATALIGAALLFQ
jgi:hypothetical protein